MKLVLQLFLVNLFSVAAFAQVTGNDCSKLLAKGIVDEKMDVSDQEYRSFFLQELCGSKYASRSERNTLEIEAIVKAFWASSGSGNEEATEAREEICSKYESEAKSRDFSLSNSKIHSSTALQAWKSCIDAASEGWRVKYNVQHDRAISIAISHTGGGTYMIRGVNIVPATAFTCLSSESVGEGSDRTVGPNSLIKVDTHGWSMVCERKISKQVVKGVVTERAPASTINVQTGDSVFSLPIAELENPALSVKTLRHLRAELAEASLPIGTVIAWRPTVKEGQVRLGKGEVGEPQRYNRLQTPPGWVLCDGSDARAPDLREKFIYGWARVEDIGAVGGAPGHNHSVSIPLNGVEWLGAEDGDNISVADKHHNHSGSTDQASNLPPFVKLVYIMKVSDNSE